MRIKKLAAVILSAALALSMCACTAKEEKVEKAPFDEATYLENVTNEVVENLTKLSKDPNYIGIYSYEDNVTDIAAECAALSADYSDGYYEIDVAGSIMDTILAVMDQDGEFGSISDISKDYLKTKFAGSLPGYINGRAGVYYVVITSALNYARTYVPDGAVSDRVRFIPTDKENIYYCVSFVNTGDGALSVSATYVFSSGDLMQEIKDVFGITAKKVNK